MCYKNASLMALAIFFTRAQITCSSTNHQDDIEIFTLISSGPQTPTTNQGSQDERYLRALNPNDIRSVNREAMIAEFLSGLKAKRRKEEVYGRSSEQYVSNPQRQFIANRASLNGRKHTDPIAP